MSDGYYDRREVKREANFWGGQTAKWIVLGVILMMLIGGAIWTVRVVSSPVRGQGDAYVKQQSAENRIKTQREFNARFQGIKAMDRNITLAAAELKADPKNTVKSVNYSGLVRNCNDAVGEYNTLARSYLAENFRDVDLPYQIDSADPTTDCKE